jgi:hypothetical protein
VAGATPAARAGARILFLISGGEKVASSRYRVLQYLPFLEKAGLVCDVWVVEKGAANRLKLFSKLGNHDLTFIQKRLFQPWDLFWIRKKSRRLLYDLDDAVMYRPTGEGGESITRRYQFRNTAKCADWVIAGNAYLQAEVQRYHPRVSMIPTVLDHRGYTPKTDHGLENRVTIGWIGSRANLHYLAEVGPALDRLFDAHPKVQLKVVADAGMQMEKIPVIEKRWSAQDEREDLRSFDIGIMPLLDDAWTRGKCGFKIIQYMATGLPVVCSPVGANKEILQGGITGFFATSDDEWQRNLSMLIENPALRARMGAAGRQRVEDRYSLQQSAPHLIDLLNRLYHDGVPCG